MSKNASTDILKEQLLALEPLLRQLLQTKQIAEKLEILSSQPNVKAFLAHADLLRDLLKNLNSEKKLLVLSIVAIGQGETVFTGLREVKGDKKPVEKLLEQLQEVEKFYDSIGGIVGYQVIALNLITQQETGCDTHLSSSRFLKPEGVDLSQDTPEVRKAVMDGLQALPEIAEIYPVGGAGDRLMLRHEETEALLPAACLQFCGKSLLEGMVQDVQAREYLYYKVYGKQLSTPIALMTSEEKSNDALIYEICAKKKWFGRSKEDFFFFKQPLAPVFTKEGEWVLSAPFHLTMKPGGHGVIWKLARDSGVLAWLKRKNRDKTLVRQINNPLTGVDYGLLGFLGIGCHLKKSFGFASCERLVNAAEGMNVLLEQKCEKGFDYCITNIEYTEFTKKGIQDVPECAGSPYSRFPANTNILFGNLDAIEEAVKTHPLPGLLLNIKTKTPCLNKEGVLCEKEAGRLETIMQNIADVIVDHYPQPIQPVQEKELKTFLTYNKRAKTISVTKRAYVPDKEINETPEGCFYDLLHTYQDLFANHCHLQMPSLNTPEEYLKEGPSFLVLFHPALGPFYSIISQKIQGGLLAKKAEMQLQIAELELKNVQVEGSLLIHAHAIMGMEEAKGILQYSEKSGKCELRNVKIVNKGIDWSAPNVYWKNQILRKERVVITLQEDAEFFADGVTFHGNHTITVPPQHRMIAYEKEGKLQFKLERISSPSWFWKYQVDSDHRVTVTK